MSTKEELKERIARNLAELKRKRRLEALHAWNEDADSWYAAEIERTKDNAPA